MKKLTKAACKGVEPGHNMPNTNYRNSYEGHQKSSTDRLNNRKYEQCNAHLTNNDSKEAGAGETFTENCRGCEGNCPKLEKCANFLKMSVNSRWNLIKSHRICRICLLQHTHHCHVKTFCGINRCSRRHNSLLHWTPQTTATPLSK
ncbi:uncharacterized protein LOC120908294 [Anopheles arabiensis]|nr:uncharacterized protein LOC120908287 [Anopheles arabiensis]XP_040175142.1 uncharacterized protein LOC120908294 [Anopheles arabiensis]